IITVATLLNAERPERRQRHVSSKVGIAAHNLFDRGAVEEIIVQLAAFSPKPNAFLRQPAKIEIAAITVVEKHAVGQSVFQSDVERNCLIDWIAAFVVAGRVGIPINEEAAALIKAGCFFAKAVKMFVETQLFRDRDKLAGAGIELNQRERALSVVSHWLLVRVDCLVRARIAEFDQQRRSVNDGLDFGCRNRDRLSSFRDIPRSYSPIIFRNRPRMIPGGNWFRE